MTGDGPSGARLLAVAFLTGAAVMVVELMAVRLMAPWFGQSQLVWTNVIGVVLASLAAGQWLGGRWAEGRGGFAPGTLLFVAGALALALPDLVALLGGLILPDDLRLIEAYPFVTWGSLLVALVGLGTPLAALGAVTPWIVRMSREATVAPGRVAGRVLGAGTLGSLLGTFGATHVLLPAVGSALAVRLAGVALLAAAFALGRPRRLVAALWFLPLLAALGPERERPGLLEAVETPYQFAYVDEDEDGTRRLRINEALDSFHSVTVPGTVLTGMYYDAFLLPALLAPPGGDATTRVFVVGLGGGTMARQLAMVAPSIEVSGVEIDAELLRLGRDWLDLPDGVEVAVGQDGRMALAATRDRYGAILVDAYAQQIYLPQHLCTVEFFEQVRDRLVDGGVAALNLGGLTWEDPVVQAVAGTFATVLDDVVMARVPGTRNLIALGWKGDAPDPARWAEVLVAHDLDEPLGWVVDGGLFAAVPRATEPLRDGDAPVEALAHASWRALWDGR